MRTASFLAAIAVTAGAASIVLQGPVPGDAALTAALQATLGTGGGWAGWLTATAKAPILWATIALAGGLAWRVAGWRAALAAALVAVAEPAASSGLPSTFGLVYGALFGVALLARGSARKARPARLIAGALLIAGIAARIVSGGHWPSQMLASSAFGLLLALAALAIIQRLRFGRRQ